MLCPPGSKGLKVHNFEPEMIDVRALGGRGSPLRLEIETSLEFLCVFYLTECQTLQAGLH
jgi:hypothetical protein